METTNGQHETWHIRAFTKGSGEPLCITHHYSQFNETGDYFADVFTATHRVLLINLRDAGNSAKAQVENELSMIETIHDLEAIREALQLPIWHFAGHSTGGMLGLLYAITYPKSLQSLVVVGAAQVTILKHHFVFIIRNILSFIICNSSSKI